MKPHFPRIAALILLVSGLPALMGDTPAKPYRLFVGMDLLLKTGDETLTVESLKPHEAIVGPSLQSVHLRDVPAFSWTRVPKVGRSPVVIDGLKSERTHTIQNDPAMQWMNTQNTMAIYQQEAQAKAEMEFYTGQRDRQARHALAAQSQIKQNRGEGGIIGAPTMEGMQREEMKAMENMMGSLEQIAQMQDSTLYADRTQAALGQKNQNVLELEFDVSSHQPIADAYVVIMGDVVQESGNGVVVFHQNIGVIGPAPRHIKIRKLGFEPGFEISNVTVHVYAHGKELATNLSERAVAMTRDEAREFLLLSHIADHAVESVTPTPVWNLAPPALLAADAPADFDYPVVVNVDADGRIISIHNSETEARAYLAEIHDASELRTMATPGKSLAESVRVTAEDDGVAFDQTGHLPPRVVAAMRDLFFLPALDLGTPVPGTARVNLAEFFR